ncbi:MAG: DUF2809 domain-containing protein [Gluconacetobacter diazotrophicus]|nr:DUF2809 domain-containing protein [Gluconacetobacter diazotrophicus]
MPSRPAVISAALLAATVLLGLAARFAPLGLPPVLVKYGGSFFWAMAIYVAVSALPMAPGSAATASAGLAIAIECFKLVRSPGLDRFRQTLPGILLLGRHFAVLDIVVYLLAIAAGWALDLRLRRRC